ALCLSLLSQSALSQVPRSTDPSLARTTRPTHAARAPLSTDLHAAVRTALSLPGASQAALRAAPQICRFVVAQTDARSALPGCTTRHPGRAAHLVPVRALSVIFRAKMREGLRRAGLLDQVPSRVWRSAWVVHCQPAGSGRKVLEYLARYVFRVAITNSRLEA